MMKANPDEVYSNVSDRFFCVLIADTRGLTAAVSDQTSATICKQTVSNEPLRA
jgi:hypothetical protein